MAKSSILDVWFYVNPETQVVDAAICYFPLGISKRVDSDWEFTTKEEAGLYTDLAKHDVYQLDWETDQKVIDDSFDFDNYDDANHEAIKLFDKGELTLEALKGYSEFLYSGSDLGSAEDGEE